MITLLTIAVLIMIIILAAAAAAAATELSHSCMVLLGEDKMEVKAPRGLFG